jgi:hypothetical protein
MKVQAHRVRYSVPCDHSRLIFKCRSQCRRRPAIVGGSHLLVFHFACDLFLHDFLRLAHLFKACLAKNEIYLRVSIHSQAQELLAPGFDLTKQILSAHLRFLSCRYYYFMRLNLLFSVLIQWMLLV